MVFVNRVDAGRQLAERLRRYQGPDVVVLGLPRGGVPVAFEVARALGAPLDVIVVRKLGVALRLRLRAEHRRQKGRAHAVRARQPAYRGRGPG
jgi:putative phosphoribosyl transferase